MKILLAKLGPRAFGAKEHDMLEHVPAWPGGLLRNRRAGHQKLVAADPDIGLAASNIELGSPAFAPCTRLPVRFTADGEGVSPPLFRSAVPVGTYSRSSAAEDAPAFKEAKA